MARLLHCPERTSPLASPPPLRVIFCDAAKASPLALPLGELSAQLTERAVILHSLFTPPLLAPIRPYGAFL